MKEFRFATDKKIIREVIEKAEKFLYIVAFQFTAESFIRDILLEKSRNVELSIITLPSDSYKATVERSKIDKLYQDLEKNGARIHQCIWEVGDPSLTATSQSGKQAEGGGDKWYSMHGKFIVTDKSALITSSNFTDTEEIEVYLLSSESRAIKQFMEKFNQLEALFVEENVSNYPGNVFSLLDEETKNQIKETFKSSGRLNIKAYPPKLTPSNPFANGLYIAPFEGRAREFLNSLIDNAQEFLYFSTERFFDDELVKKMVAKAVNTNIKIRLMTCPPNQIRQNPVKAEEMLSELVSAGIEVKLFENIHAKCWIADTSLAIGSINLGKMNLGFRKTRDFWRANTETIYFDNDKELIKEAKREFEKVFAKGRKYLNSISSSSKSLNDAKTLLSAFGMKSDESAREIMSQIQTIFKIDSRKNLLKIADTAVKIAKESDIRKVTRTEILMALILFHLAERKHTFHELSDKLQPILKSGTEVAQILSSLVKNSLIVKQDDFYKVNIDAIL